MKVGAEDRRQVVAAWVLTVLAVFLLVHWIFGWESSASANTVRSAWNIGSSETPARNTKADKFDPMDPTLDFSRLALTEHEGYEGSGRNIFRSYGEDRPEKILPLPKPQPAPPTPTPSPASTIGLKFFGIATISGLPRKVCLSQEGDVFIGGEGDLVDRRYKILRIGTNTVDIQDLLGNNQYTLKLQQ